jgi:4-alpha-glucanotransferase/(1->4)-alpha-D-glucan 1-alpha-D-glucosylmutase
MDPSLEKLAAECGIEPGYHDVWGTWRPASEKALRAILAAMGVDAANPEAALAERRQRSWKTVVPPVTVRRARSLGDGVRIHLPEASLARSLSWRLVTEDGEIREGRFDPQALATSEGYRRDGLHVWAFKLPLPAPLADGYHRLAILENGARLGEGMLIVAPERCYLPATIAEGARVWGAAAQLYGIRSGRNAGIGDFTDLRHSVEAWGERGAALVGTNPLHAVSLLDPGRASPYSPSSRLFLNPLYIDVEAIEDYVELAAADEQAIRAWEDESARLRAADEVDYARIARAKRAMFDALFAHFATAHLAAATRRARAFSHFRETRGLALRRHALHEALAEVHGPRWREWPEAFRNPGSAEVARFAAQHANRVSLHEYIQWQADLQLGHAQARARELGMAVGLYADLAISIAADGSEAWAHQDLYALGVSVGAPPDEFNLAGQDWGLPPLVPERLRENAYAPLIATLRANMARAGALRIDHVMGLSRLYWVPGSMSAVEGAYVSYPVDELLGIVALESHRHRSIVIGEDLGTVPGNLRQVLERADVLSYRLLLFEREGAAFKPPSSYPRRALVAWSTHDLPTLAGWWQEEDLRVRRALGLLGEEELDAQRRERAQARAALLEALAKEDLIEPGTIPAGGPPSEELMLAVSSFLAKTPSAVMVVQMEDVFGVADQANLPGTVDQHPNWRRKLPVPVEQWARDPRFKRLTRRLATLRGRSQSRREFPPGMEEARIPRATYRVQLHGEFTFRDAAALVPYLAALGVSHIYCSPYLRARPGSQHGYDIIDHESLNPEIGTRDDFAVFVAELRQHGMSHVMDVVPNHMGVHGEDNAWWQDVLENGPASALADFFDIDWLPPSEHLANRVLLPILGDRYGVELAAGRIALAFEAKTGAFAARYGANRLPIDPHEYPRILAGAVRGLEAAGEDLSHQAQALRSIAESFARLPERDARERSRMDERNLGKEVAKGRLGLLARSQAAVGEAIESAIAAFHGRPGDAASFDALHELLEAQPYRLAYWRVAQDEINYRRFFDINELAALRQENGAVFEATHRLVAALVNEGLVDALRIDHPDGLYDPKDYFQRLQAACARPVYVVVEKIVAPFENVPEDWAVHGTTGYRFANVVNGLFVDPAAETRMTRTYHGFIRDATGFEEVARRARRQVLRAALASELTVLTSRLARISRADRHTRDFTFTTLRDGLAEVIAAFPVYRTYIDDEVRPEDRRYIEWAVAKARAGSLAADVSVFDFIRDALAGELPARSPAVAAAARHFARKVQQLTAPVMAKGVEDTALYVYNRLVSLNDVGGDPAEFGFPPARFHQASAHRARRWPHTMLATSTHDNKRSEDVRARINVLSEMAAAWRLQVHKWNRMNQSKKALVDGEPVPSRNDEYLLYQTLIGSFPPDQPRGAALRQYRDRITAYMQKAAREAKSRTSWARVNEPYEAATTAFVHAILDETHANPFLDDFRAAVEPVIWIGFLNSLSVAAVKYTSPGVPDTYQGNEIWDFSLVDPDNRRPVDYKRRQAMLAKLQALGASPGAAVDEIFAELGAGRAKLYVTWRLLRLRAAHEALFLKGGYTAVRARGEHARHVVAFARRHEGAVTVTIAPRLIAGLGIGTGELPCGIAVWGDARIELPFLDEGTVLRDVFTGREHRVTADGLALGDLLERAPVSVLVR